MPSRSLNIDLKLLLNFHEVLPLGHSDKHEQLLPSSTYSLLGEGSCIHLWVPLSCSQCSPDGMGCPSLNLHQEKSESRNNMYLITFKHKFMTYNNSNTNRKIKKIIVTMTMNKHLQQLQNYDVNNLGQCRQ
jgi:hypothetical protein